MLTIEWILRPPSRRSQFTALDDDILREGLAIEGIDQPCSSVPEWERRISKFGLTVDEKCRQCFLSSSMNFLAEYVPLRCSKWP